MSTDSEILQRSRETPGAFAELFERHARVIAAFAVRRVGADHAEDVLSETFLVAFRRRADFDQRWESAKPWLLSDAVRALAPRIAALASRDRETLLLYAWGDLSYEEVAVALGVPVGTVKSRLNRVRRQLAPPGSRTSARLTWIAKEEF